MTSLRRLFVRRVSSLLLGCSSVWACGGVNANAPRPCTLEARSSITLQVVDPRGTVQLDARVTFTLDGGPEQQALCDGVNSTPGNCTSWVTNYETAGEYVITARSADGERSVQKRVTVRRDECHVQGQVLKFVLPD